MCHYQLLIHIAIAMNPLRRGGGEEGRKEMSESCRGGGKNKQQGDEGFKAIKRCCVPDAQKTVEARQ